MMFQTILCPVDFSPFSQRALSFAASLAEKYAAKLIVLHVIEDVIPAYANFIIPTQVHDVERELHQFASREMDEFLTPYQKQRDLERVLLSGRPLDAILKTSQQRKVDLVVMGTHGKSFLEKALFGSTTEKVLRRIHLPVLLVNLP